jgi:flavodoxin I
MKKVLIIYTTNSGGTFAVGEVIKDILSKICIVNFQNVNETKPDDYIGHDLVVLASPSWKSRGEEGMPTEAMLKFLDIWKTKKLPQIKFALYGCGDEEFAHFCGAVDYLENFVQSVQGTLVIESLRLNSFWFELDKGVEMAKSWAKQLAVILK